MQADLRPITPVASHARHGNRIGSRNYRHVDVPVGLRREGPDGLAISGVQSTPIPHVITLRPGKLLPPGPPYSTCRAAILRPTSHDAMAAIAPITSA